MSPDVFSGVKWSKMRWQPGLRHGPRWEAYSTPRPPSWTRSSGTENDGRNEGRKGRKRSGKDVGEGK